VKKTINIVRVLLTSALEALLKILKEKINL